MKGELSKQLVSELGRRMLTELPSWETCASPLRGARVFRSASGGVTRFLIFQLDQTHNAFTVEVAWSTTGELPVNLRQFAFDPEGPAVDGGLRLRISSLQGRRDDTWWNVVTGTDGLRADQPKRLGGRPREGNKVSECLDEALRIVHELAVPYLDGAGRKPRAKPRKKAARKPR